MALDTYSGLKTAIQTWLARADLSSDVDDMIDMFEAWCNRNLRVPQMEQEATTAAAEYLALPVDFLEMRDIQWQGQPRRQLDYVTPSVADQYDTSGTSGIPAFYTLVGDQIRLIPAPNATTDVRMDYWKKVPALTNSNTTNWLLDLYPDAYLYGCLVHGQIRIANPEIASFVSQGWAQIMREIESSGKHANVGSQLQMRVV